MLDLYSYDWLIELLHDLLGEEMETEEVKKKKEELQEAWRQARVQWWEKQAEKREEKRALVPTFPPGFLRMGEEEFRSAIEQYARGHPEEKVSGTAVDRDNLIYRALQVHRRIEEKKEGSR